MTAKKTFDRIFKEWVSTLVGTGIMGLSGFYLYKNIDSLNTQSILTAALLGSVGFIFLFVKDSIITGIFKKTQK